MGSDYYFSNYWVNRGGAMSDMKDRVMQVILTEADVEKGFIPDHAKNKFSDNSGKLKCPFCDSEIEQLNDQQRSLFHCSNIVCCKGGHYIGNISMWRDLIRTRKALDVAVDALKELKETVSNTE